MTIIQPNRGKFHFSLTLAVLLFLTVASAILSIYFYTSIVDIRFSLDRQAKALQATQVVNADLKNDLYKMLAFDNWSRIASELALIKETKPGYLQAGVSVAVKTP